MKFERHKDPRETMEIGITEKYKEVLNKMAMMFYGKLPEPYFFEDAEVFIEKSMEWPRGAVSISELEEKNGIQITVSKFHLKKLGIEE